MDKPETIAMLCELAPALLAAEAQGNASNLNAFGPGTPES